VKPRDWRFLIWPEYVVQTGGREVRLSRKRGEILTILLMRPGRYCPPNEMIELIYPDPDREPDWAYGALKVHIFRMRQAFREAGIETDLRGHWYRGYSCTGFAVRHNGAGHGQGRNPALAD
jgi:DNA-binding response OmpR family regulator